VSAHFLLVAADTEDVHGAKISAYQVARSRIRASRWFMYQRTPHRSRIKAGDAVLIYTAGSKPGGGQIIASATVKRVDEISGKAVSPEGDLLTEVPVVSLTLEQVQEFSRSVAIREVRDMLSFIPKHQRWGAVLQGGCRAITRNDYETVMDMVSEHEPG
jgi:EVE domain